MTPQSKHVVMVMEENQSYATVVGNTTDWPNLNGLINHGALANKLLREFSSLDWQLFHADYGPIAHHR